jgi:hypothetical protein
MVFGKKFKNLSPKTYFLNRVGFRPDYLDDLLRDVGNVGETLLP